MRNIKIVGKSPPDQEDAHALEDSTSFKDKKRWLKKNRNLYAKTVAEEVSNRILKEKERKLANGLARKRAQEVKVEEKISAERVRIKNTLAAQAAKVTKRLVSREEKWAIREEIRARKVAKCNSWEYSAQEAKEEKKRVARAIKESRRTLTYLNLSKKEAANLEDARNRRLERRAKQQRASSLYTPRMARVVPKVSISISDLDISHSSTLQGSEYHLSLDAIREAYNEVPLPSDEWGTVREVANRRSRDITLYPEGRVWGGLARMGPRK